MMNLSENSGARLRPGGREKDSAAPLGGLRLAVAGAVALLLGACAGTPDYSYRFVPGRTAVLRDGKALAPAEAPPAVKAAIAAGNRIAGRPYRRGGGHRRVEDDAYDCSGAVSYVLGSIGELRSPMPSTGFRRYGKPGPGRWITVYARRGHVFLVVAGLRFDTGWGRGARGPHWSTRTRPAEGFVARHPPGL